MRGNGDLYALLLMMFLVGGILGFGAGAITVAAELGGLR